jgi:hypothetical protein
MDRIERRKARVLEAIRQGREKGRAVLAETNVRARVVSMEKIRPVPEHAFEGQATGIGKYLDSPGTGRTDGVSTYFE